ncbi:MAG TPA: efflux RND transporter periplasmic adaptor subunit [Chthonomonadaceae bacterium]|nr:efflux RND transporter periplasmic adaptor subunit [Chthonomonadaceae bacterium]
MASVSSPAPSARRRVKQKTRALPTIVTLVVLVGLGWWGWAKTHPAENPLNNLVTATVTRGDLTETVSATGSITAQTGAEVHIGSQITGTISHLYADVGTYVHKGQVIAQLNLPDIQAQYDQAQANMLDAQTKLQQQQSGVQQVKVQTSSSISQARAALNNAEAQLAAAEANANQQNAQTPTDIERARTALTAAQAALSTAQSNYKQAQASANLQISTAQAQLTQAQANYKNSTITLARDQALLKQGYVPQSQVDTDVAQNTVNQAQVDSAQQNVALVRTNVAAGLQSAKDQVTQAQQNVASARAALTAAKAEPYLNASKAAAVNSARAAVGQAQANLQAAIANSANDVLKQQDVEQAREQLQASRDQVAYSKAQWDKTIIRSPISGTVLQMAAQQGETLAAGLSAPTVIIVADLSRLEVDAYVDETDIGSIRIGQPVDIKVDAFPQHTFTGRVFKIASGSTIQSGVVTYDVSISIDKTPHRFRGSRGGNKAGGFGNRANFAAGGAGGPGMAANGANQAGQGPAGGGQRRAPQLKPDMTASVTIYTGTRHNVLLVPSEAVKLGTSGATVNVLTKKDGKINIQPVRVRTGASDGVNTEIRDGLTEGQTIVLAGSLEGPGGRGFGPQSPFGPQNRGGGNRGGGGGGGRGGGRGG